MTSQPLNSTTPQIAASILSADFAKLAAEIADVDRAGVDFLHLDVLDGHFAPNISFGPAVTAATRRSTKAFLDIHLMITDPLRYAPEFLKAGADGLTFHVEVAPNPADTARQLRQMGCKHVGITLNPATPVEKIYPALDVVDHVLVMMDGRMQAFGPRDDVLKRVLAREPLPAPAASTPGICRIRSSKRS